MPTKHRRLAIIRDEKVEEALRIAREAREGEARSDASIARELILERAREVERAARDQDEFDEWILEHGGTPAKGSMRELLDEVGPLPPYDPDDPYPAQRALEETREDRI